MNSKVQFDPHYLHRTTLFSNIPVYNNPVVFLGDSITEMCEWQEFFPDTTIRNRGVSGDSTAGVLNRLDQIINLNPSKVFLTIGVNDLQRHYPKEEVISNIKKIVLKLIALTDAKIFLQSILPVREKMLETGIKNSTIKEVNKALLEICNETGIEFIDNFRLFCDNSGNLAEEFTSDGLHLNGFAYLKWVENIRSKVIGE